jgi:hypothetical protein
MLGVLKIGTGENVADIFTYKTFCMQQVPISMIPHYVLVILSLQYAWQSKGVITQLHLLHFVAVCLVIHGSYNTASTHSVCYMREVFYI